MVQDLTGGNVLLVEGDTELSPDRLRAKVHLLPHYSCSRRLFMGRNTVINPAVILPARVPQCACRCGRLACNHGELAIGNLPRMQVADFGLSRSLQVASRLETETYGTVTHM